MKVPTVSALVALCFLDATLAAPSFPTLFGRAASTQDDVVNKKACTDLTVIFARGTGEPGNIGYVAGPPMYDAIEKLLGRTITKQGVTYPASAAGNANQGADGGPTMAKLVNQAISQCPNSKIIISGYSQGAMVVHNAAKQSGFPASKISGVIVFGDPLRSQAVQGISASKLKSFCAPADGICGNSGSGAGHTSYGSNANDAAAFVKSAAGL